MCGIAGIGHVPQQKWSQDLQQLGSVICGLKKRGPDGMTLFAESGFALAQTFLSITDQARGITPYLSNDQRFIAVVNGEIYNHEELRTDLELRGLTFTSRSDCEVIANGFSLFGKEYLAKLQGMFAIAILDRLHQTLVLARDAVGIRPLYYSEQDGQVAFSSEIQTLVDSGLVTREPDEEAYCDAIVIRAPIEPKTIYKSIKAVMPGNYVEFDGKGCTSYSFMNDPFAFIHPSLVSSEISSIYPKLRATITESISTRIPNESKYLTFISGGLDSGIVAALSPHDDKNRLPSLVCGFSNSIIPDERVGARNLANYLKLPLDEITLNSNKFLAIWPYMLAPLGAPLMFNSTIPIFGMCRYAHSNGGKVIISGEGADELFLGYSHYDKYAQLKDDGSPEFLMVADPEINHPQEILSNVLVGGQLPSALWNGLRERMYNLAPSQSGQSGLDRKLRFDRLIFLRNLLMRQDRAGLGTAIEIRVPFLDLAVISLARSIPSGAHISTSSNKLALRRAFKKTLGTFSATPKVGFPLPLTAWLNSESFLRIIALLKISLKDCRFFRDDALDISLENALKNPLKPPTLLWTILNIAAWSLFQSSGKEFYSLWHNNLDEEGQFLMNKLSPELLSDVPSWLAELLSQCESASGGIVATCVHWEKPKLIQYLKPLSLQ